MKGAKKNGAGKKTKVTTGVAKFNDRVLTQPEAMSQTIRIP
jgi:hypothetical protein